VEEEVEVEGMAVDDPELDSLQKMNASMKQLLLCQVDCGVCTNLRQA